MKNLHIIAFTTSQNPAIQLAANISENRLISLNIGQGVKVLDTLILDGEKLQTQLSDPLLEIIEEKEKEEVKIEDEKQISIKKMIVSTKYLAETYGSKLEQKHITNLIKKVYEQSLVE